VDLFKKSINSKNRLVETLKMYNNNIKKTRQGYAPRSILKPTGYFFYKQAKNGV
jgi:hypothetical protein